MADCIATAVREGDRWVIDVEGVGTTQADGVDEMALDLVSALAHTAPRDVHMGCDPDGREGLFALGVI